MKNVTQIDIERPIEKVFAWMFQPEHLVQLVTYDFTQDIFDDDYMTPPPGFKSPDPNDPVVAERIARRRARHRRFVEQSESQIEIEHLSTPTLQYGTTFDYRLSMRSRSTEAPSYPPYPNWKTVYSGSITIDKAASPTFFSFTTSGTIVYKSLRSTTQHQLAFRVQQGQTIITDTQIRTENLAGMLVGKAVKNFIPGMKNVLSGMSFLGQEVIWRKFQAFKTQMEAEIA